MELPQTFFGDGEIGVLVVDYFVDVWETPSEVEVVFGALGAFQGDVVELEVALGDGAGLEHQAVAVFVLLGDVEDLLWG